jgi:dihydrofolate reductase
MRKIIAAINMTLDGFCDHTGFSPDEEIHDHYTKLLNDADAILYGRITYELMEFWQPFLANPSGEKSMDDFALAIDRIPKIIFSNSLKRLGWESAILSERPLEETVSELSKLYDGTILVGSRSLIIGLANLNLIDEYQICIHPVLAGSGMPLFDKIEKRTVLELLKIKGFKSGAIINYYKNATFTNKL